MRFTEEHAYGVSVWLWQQQNSVFGLLDVAEGLQGDTPTGLLEDVRFDAVSSRMSFKAKLTVGLHYCSQHQAVPSRDLFEFRGQLKHGSLVGELTRSDGLHPGSKPQTERVALKKTERIPSIEADNYAEWKHRVDQILKFRGPKW